MRKPEETRTYAYQITTGSGALERRFVVELSRPLERNPNRPQESLLEQLREAMQRPAGPSSAGETVVLSVKEVNPMNGNPERSSPERLRDGLSRSMGEIFIVPVARP